MHRYQSKLLSTARGCKSKYQANIADDEGIGLRNAKLSSRSEDFIGAKSPDTYAIQTSVTGGIWTAKSEQYFLPTTSPTQRHQIGLPQSLLQVCKRDSCLKS